MISILSRFTLLSTVIIMAIPHVSAQDYSLEEIPPGLRDRAVVMEIATRIIEQNQNVAWDSENTKITIPGRPVGLRLVGDNIIVVVQFTPFMRSRGNNFLVAQGQVWLQIPNEGLSFYTCMETIPLEFNELIYFFPLGSGDFMEPGSSEIEPQIEIQIVLYPYNNENWDRSRRNPQ